MDEATEHLQRELHRVRRFPDFDSSQRAWWLYLREAVAKWLEQHEDETLRAAHNGVKAFPENLPDERARWLKLREAVAATLGR